ncbi:MAG: GIY-YIG nuclease family protein [Lachnospiraceae bacterium]|nr:GIY-YIG nuclease family protein [Lachnospiraceae bacterium]
MNENLRKAKAIEAKNKKRLLAIDPYLDEGSGIYFLVRKDENGIKYAYIGQAKHLLTRLAQHLSGYQHIDLSLKKHGLYSSENVYGWKIGFLHFQISELDFMEKKFIQMYSNNGYQLRNKTAGGQGEGKTQIDDYRPAKGYRDGIAQGRKNLAKELTNIIDKHLCISIKEEKKNNKVSIKAFEKFNDLLYGDKQ